MALESNVMELISPAAAAIPGTVSATLSRLSTWRGEDADGAFDERIDALAGSVDPDAAARVTVERIDMGNPAACYWSVSGESLGRSIRARLVLPSGQGAHPLILMFHDAGRPVRGWHHMTRFAGVGMAVLALDQEEGPFEDVLLDAIALKAATRAVSVLDPSSISTWGEGLGGSPRFGCRGSFGRRYRALRRGESLRARLVRGLRKPCPPCAAHRLPNPCGYRPYGCARQGGGSVRAGQSHGVPVSPYHLSKARTRAHQRVRGPCARVSALDRIGDSVPSRDEYNSGARR